jgi:imidazolonepropionase-like amidohydrolase
MSWSGWSRVTALVLAVGVAARGARAQADSGKGPRATVLVRAGRLVAVRAGTVLTNQAILIEGDRIKEVGPADAVAGHAPRDARVIDLRNATVLPGLIDCHTHITSDPGDYYQQLFRMSAIDEAVRAHIYAKRTLDAGFTTVRNVGAAEFIDVALRNAINDGAVPGPRMLVSTMPLSATGGHGDVNGMSPYLHFDGFSGIANGVDQIREKIRFEVKYGADLIKVLASAGVLSEEESVGAPQYSQEELNALVEEAGMWGRKVAAHAHGAEAIKRAVRAGVASIEHGSLIDDEGIRLMKEHGTYLVADIYNDDYILAEYTRLGYPQKIIDKERLVGRLQRENFKKAVQAGVKIAFGTDAGVYPHGWNAKQFAHMVRWGTTPMQAIQAATVNAADLLGWSDKVGALEPGKYADVIAVNGDPLQDVTVLEHVAFVMKGGEVVKDNLTGGAKTAR